MYVAKTYFIFLSPVFYFKFIIIIYQGDLDTMGNGSWGVSIRRGEKKRGDGRVQTAECVSNGYLCLNCIDCAKGFT